MVSSLFVGRDRFRAGQVLLRFVFVSALLVCGYVLAPSTGFGQEDDDYRPGLVATFRQPGRPVLRRVDLRPILQPRRVTPDERMRPGRFSVTWKGLFETDGQGAYRLSAYLRGRVEIRLGDRVVLRGERAQPGWIVSEQLDLPYEWLAISIQYESPDPSGHLRLFWEGPQFSLEPIPARVYSHSIDDTIEDDFERGRDVARVLRCAACHADSGTSLASPDLRHSRFVLRATYVRDRLMMAGPASEKAQTGSSRHMPYYGLSRDQAEDIVAFLWSQSRKPPQAKASWRTAVGKKKSGVQGTKMSPEEQGHELVWKLGCAACHELDAVGGEDLYGGPRLADTARKRPAGFVVNWLADPASLQPRHRMPTFELSRDEATAIAAWLQKAGGASQSSGASWRPAADASAVARGKQLVARLGCANCHEIAGVAKQPLQPRPQRWNAAQSCVVERSRHGRVTYVLTAGDRDAITGFFESYQPVKEVEFRGEQRMRERACLQCHRRGASPGIAPMATKAGELLPKLSSRVPAMVPPPLDAVGDKLTDQALRDAIERRHAALRPYLDIRMPRFDFESGEVDAIAQRLIAEDRVPEGYPARSGEVPQAGVDEVTLRAAGARLVTSDGFGCTSCHAVGGVLPAAAPLNARGPELTLPGKRIRRSWFDRWVRNPSRIVPRMEMPGVTIPVHGLLDDDLDRQLAAIWEVLNREDFVPPAPNPVRIVRQSGVPNQPHPRSIFITDVVRHGETRLIKPLVIGLPNRHNIVYDLAAGRMQYWTTGDIARQRTEGKSWYWELGGAVVTGAESPQPEVELRKGTRRIAPIRNGQFVTEFDEVAHELESGGLRFSHRLHFKLPDGERAIVHVTQTWHSVFNDDSRSGFDRTVRVAGVPDGWQVVWRPFPGVRNSRISADGTECFLPGPAGIRATITSGDAAPLDNDDWVLGSPEICVQYRAHVSVDRFPYEETKQRELAPRPLHVLPGFRVTRLAFPEEIMPTAIGWLRDGKLVFTSLKGRVWLAEDRDDDGLEERLWPASDELAAPYGLFAGDGYLDVINKYALLRLWDVDGDGRFDRYRTVASGWGHTADYHDWAVGLPRDKTGAYFIALPCQQDDRTEVEARYRGKVLRLVPRRPTPDDPRLYAIDVVSGGHRFPMGIALSRDGQLFVTDNQGNYNPFNELNHVRRGARYGFYNALEKKQGLQFATTPPSIKIPHPWTRSVNGICFLDAPSQPSAFGVFTGDLVGCEFNERLLVRMSLEKVNGKYQGAVYPFTLRTPTSGPPLLGPVAAAVSPQGDLYVGCLRDSGWGGANNIGSVVQCRFDPASILPGIAHVRATPDGFEITFTRPIDRRRAADANQYHIASYTRIPTPAYGGPDVDRRVEAVREVRVFDAGDRVAIQLQQPLRAGYVYEFKLGALAGDHSEFFPAEAYYTLLEIPRPAKKETGRR